MSTQRYLIGDLLRKGRANQTSTSRWDFSIDLGIEAEYQSVYYALAMPEYLETWLRPAGCGSVSLVQKPSGYSIKFLFGDLLPSINVDVSFNICLLNQVVLNWTMAGSTSIVLMHLQPSGERTILHLRHRRFASAEASIWHGALWTSSLERLAVILEHPGTESNRGRAHFRAISALHRNKETSSSHSDRNCSLSVDRSSTGRSARGPSSHNAQTALMPLRMTHKTEMPGLRSAEPYRSATKGTALGTQFNDGAVIGGSVIASASVS